MRENEIIVLYGTDYLQMAKRLAAEADLAGRIGDQKKRIGIKPNLVAPVPAAQGATTHPEIVAGLIEYLQEHGFRDITVMEGSWVGDRTEESFEACGYRELSRRYGVPLTDAQKEPYRTVDCAGMELRICECALQTDFMINVPVMKGHCQTRITCALKNMKGLLPNAEKRRFHAEGLYGPIAHLAAGLRQDFILVDSICGDLSFEDGGHPTVMNRMFAAADPVLCDAYVCSLLHYPADEVPYIGMAEALGAGSAALSGAVIRELNDPVCELTLPDTRRVLRLSEAVEEVDSCSACYGYLIPALDMLDREGLLKDFPEKIHIGQGCRGKSGELGIGNCTRGFAHSLKGCPPTEQEMYAFLKKYREDRGVQRAGSTGDDTCGDL